MTHPGESARRAYTLATAQLGRLRTGDFDAYLAGEGELEGIYRALLTPGVAGDLTPFDDETHATVRELVILQRSICDEIDGLLDSASEALAVQRRRQAVTGAYRLPSGDSTSRLA